MSVWNNLLPNYKGETVYKLSQDVEADLLKKFTTLFNYELGGNAKIFKEHIPGKRIDLIRDKVDFTLDFQECQMVDVYTYALLRSHNNFKTVLKAAYSFYDNLINGKVIAPEISIGHINEIACSAFKAMCLNSHLNAKDVDLFGDNFVSKVKLRVDVHATGKFLKTIKNLRNLHSFRMINQDIARNGACIKGSKSVLVNKLTDVKKVKFNFFPEKMYCVNSEYKITFYKGCYYFIPKDPLAEGYIFNAKEISRLINYTDALLGAYLHADYKNLVEQEPNEIIFLKHFLTYINSLDDYNIHSGVEAWMSGVKALKCFLAGPLAMNGYKECIDERNTKGHNKLCSIDYLKKVINGISAESICLLGSVCRVAMPPDYDVPKAFCDEYTLHHEKNPCGIEIDEESELIYKNFVTYNRYAFINQFYKRYKTMPGYPKDKVSDFGKSYIAAKKANRKLKITFEQANLINLRGCLKYKSRNDDYFMYFRDTAMAKPTNAENLSDNYNDFETAKQIGHLLFAKERIDLETYKDEFDSEDIEHPIRVAFKVESAKADGRLFYIYNLKDKILLGELEENVHEFLLHIPGNAVGVPSVKLRKQMLNIIRMEAEDSAKIAPIFLSDDISKWSPHMPVRVQEDSAKFWAEIFDEPWIENIEEINKNDQVICNIMNYKGKYNSEGANKEGASGKRMTYLMVNLKAYATAILRGKYGGEKIVEGGARLLTFLDDGFTQVDVNQTKFKTDAPKVIKGYKDIQKACGYELKLSKSYPSDRYLTFLNYEYWNKRRIYDEFKSTTKLFVRKVGEVLTLAERLRECASWAVGAAESGSDAGFVYYAYIYRCVFEISSWSDKKLISTPSFICQLISPIQYGGFGLVPIHGIIAGLIRNLTAECLESLKRFANKEPDAKHAYAAVVSMTSHPKSGISVFRTPATISIAAKHLTEARITKAIERVFIESTESIYLSEFVHLSNRAAFKDWAEELVENNARTTYTTLEIIYNTTTINFIDTVLSKCKKSSSLTDLLGQKELTRLIRANVNEARVVIDNWDTYIAGF